MHAATCSLIWGEPEDAVALKAESQRIISEKLAIKDSLMTELAEWIQANKLK